MANTTRSISRSRLLVRATIGVIALLLIASGIAIGLLRADAIAITQDENHRLGVIFAEQATRSLQSVDLILQDMAEKIADSAADDSVSLRNYVSARDVYEALARRLTNLPQVDAILIIDAERHLANSDRPWPVVNLEGVQPAFLQDMSAADSGPHISQPAISPLTGQAVVYLARRLSGRNGEFLGLVMAAIRLEDFAELFSHSGFNAGENITVFMRDGEVLLRFPGQPVAPGTRLPQHSQWYKVMAAGGGYYHSPGAFAGVGPSFVSVNPLKRYPLVVDVSRIEAHALAKWRKQAGAIGAAALVATISLVLLLRALSRQITLIERSQEQIARQVEAIQASEHRFAAQSALLQATLDHMNQGLMMVDADGKVAVCNRRAIELLNMPAEVIASHPRLVDLMEVMKRRGEYSVPAGSSFDVSQVLDRHATYERRRPDGTVIEVRTLPMDGGGMVRTITDITARSVAEEMLGLAASRDQLTGVANRNGFQRGLQTALGAAQRSNTQLAILCLDLDRFKAVNDTYGHAAGDQLLCLVAQRMRDLARAGDLIARLGGDEFAFVLPGASDADAQHVCERLVESIKMPFDLAGKVARIGVSIGIAVFPKDGLTAEQLIRNGDAALYRAKATGTNTWCTCLTGEAERELERMKLEQDVRTAVEQQEFTLAYQPICDSLTRAPVAFEALCRWQHPIRGDVPPSEFIPIAEVTGLMIALGRWVIETACTEAAGWARPFSVAVNLSPTQFRDAGLLEWITETLRRTGLAAWRLHLELTEGLLLDQSKETLDTMHALRELGVRLVLDDFGVAQANLGYLRGLPFDQVKIDRSFLRALNTDRQARALVEAILAIARALGIEVIGEGVESAEQLALLCHLRCRFVQGFHLGHPASAASTRDWIAKLAVEPASRPVPQIS